VGLEREHGVRSRDHLTMADVNAVELADSNAPWPRRDV
jgi:hypothetical protein